MSFLRRIFAGGDRRRALAPLYAAVVAAARDPAWYREGQVPDTVNGRFDMVAAIAALTLLRLEREGDSAREASVLLTELFVEDMDASLRQIGIGDYVVGKHVGRMMGALGGRVAAFRAVRDDGGDMVAAVRRNIFHDSPKSEEGLSWTAGRLRRFNEALEKAGLDQIVEGRLPPA